MSPIRGSLLSLALLAGSSLALPQASISKPTQSVTVSRGNSTTATITSASGAVATASSTLAPATYPASNACGSIRSLQAKYTIANPSGTFTAPGALATQCLESVPLNRKLAVQHVKELKKYIQFQSTLNFLKNVPEGASKNQNPSSLDLVGFLDDILKDIQCDKDRKITNQWHLELAISIGFQLAHDGHLNIAGNTLSIIDFKSPIGLVSLSEDGKKLPQLYAFTFDEKAKVAYPGDPSKYVTLGKDAIKNIDGVDAVDYLKFYTDANGLQGPDARYNDAMGFFNAITERQSVGSFNDVPDTGFRIPDHKFNVTFQSGTTNIYNYSAEVGDFSPIDSGEDFYLNWVDSAAADAVKNATGSEEGTRIPLMKRDLNKINARSYGADAPGVLKPEIIDAGKTFAGYFLPKTDTAVMRLASFDPTTKIWGGNDSDTIAAYSEFFDLCRKNKKTNLIIDLSNNGGGDIILGYNLYNQLFPEKASIDVYQAQRFRITEGHKLLAKAAFLKDTTTEFIIQKFVDNSTDTKTKNDLLNLAYSGLFWKSALDPSTKKRYPSFEQYFGPQVLNGDEFSAPFSFNWTSFALLNELDPDSVFVLDTDVEKEINVDYPAQPFKEENILFVTDGRCSSTCSNFAEFLHRRGGVRFAALGGLPQLQGMPHVGGVRGSNIQEFETIRSWADAFNDLVFPATAAEAKKRADVLPAKLPFRFPSGGASVNFLDNYREGHNIPLQLEEEFADCKLFYTKETWLSFEKLWSTLAGLAFKQGGGVYKGQQGCAVGTLHK